MQIINEIRDNNGSICYERICKNNENNILWKDIICFPSFTRDQKNGCKAIIMYTSDMKPIETAFSFLNQATETYATRRQAVPALKLLFSYETIIGKKLADFTIADIEAFKDFLKGISYGGIELQFNLIETRDNGTTNTYLGIYRKYCDHIGVSNKILNQRGVTSQNVFNGNFSDKIAPYRHNERVIQESEVPMYISEEDFKRIITVIRSKYSIREEIIVRLMYEEGLRIGEVLGLTNDDIVEENIVGKGWTNVLYLRNRCSDKKVSQSAKGCMKVRTVSDYNRKEYKLPGYGFQTVPIKHDLAELINAYIEEAHLEARAKHGKEYWEQVSADRVRAPEKFEDPNFYIFLNSNGGRLLQQTWNKTMRAIFTAAGLSIDTGKRVHNLNHRFRHGFAMIHVKNGVKPLELQKLLRHTSLDSVTRYYRPTTSDVIDIKERFEKQLHTDIPELSTVTVTEDISCDTVSR